MAKRRKDNPQFPDSRIWGGGGGGGEDFWLSRKWGRAGNLKDHAVSVQQVRTPPVARTATSTSKSNFDHKNIRSNVLQISCKQTQKPCTHIAYTWALKGFLYSIFGAQVYTR